MLGRLSNDLGYMLSNINTGIITSADILISMYENEDTICHFLLNDYSISYDDIVNEANKYIVVKKDDGFTKKVNDILNLASEYMIKYHSDYVYDEHVFLAMLNIDSIAKEILIDLGVNIEDAIMDVMDIFNLEDEEELDYTKSITKKAKDITFIGREEYIKRLDLIINRKVKNNPLLIGEAGVGKTAIVEGLAKYYLDNNIDYEIISLDLGLAIAGAKYRGDFEERIMDVINKIENNNRIILFIDEIHNLVGIGGSEGGVDAANLLKPVLSRNNIKCIGATTVDEYKRYIEKDKALARRFENVFVYEPGKEEVLRILYGIKHDFENYHNIVINDEIIEYIYETSKNIPNRKFPDKAIDILDEVCAYAKINNKCADTNMVDDLLADIIGSNKGNRCRYDFLKKYVAKRYFGLNDTCLVKILFNGNEEGLIELRDSVLEAFNMNSEVVLDIDLANYTDNMQISSLVGSAPGYVGYYDGGLLNHIKKYPQSLLIIRNIDKTNPSIKALMEGMLKEGKILIQSSTVYLKNTAVISVVDEKRNISYINKNNNKLYDVEFKLYKDLTGIKERLMQKGYILDDDINNINTDEVLIRLMDYPKGKYHVSIDNDEIQILPI